MISNKIKRITKVYDSQIEKIFLKRELMKSLDNLSPLIRYFHQARAFLINYYEDALSCKNIDWKLKHKLETYIEILKDSYNETK